MKIRNKVMVIGLIALVMFLGLILVFVQVYLLGRIEDIQVSIAEKKVSIVRNIVEEQFRFLDTICVDWAAWDDTYEFVQDGNDDYRESNLVDSTFSSSNISFMIFYNRQGTIVFKKAFDLLKEAEKEVPASILQQLQEHETVLHHAALDSSVSGFLLDNEEIYYITSYPVLTSDDEGPIMGTLVMAKAVDSAFIEQVEELSQYEIELLPTASLPSTDSDSVYVSTSRGKAISGRLRFADLTGTAGFVLEMTFTDTLAEQIGKTVFMGIIAVVFIGIVSTLVVTFLVNRYIFSSLLSMTRTAVSIRNSKDFSLRFSISSKDEFELLSTATNKMLETLEKLKKEADDSSREKELLFRELAHRVKNNLQIVASLLRLQIENAGAGEKTELLADAMNRVKTIASAHEMLYINNRICTVDSSTYFENLIQSISSFYRHSDKQLTIETYIEELTMDINFAINTGLILSEILTNAIKHAFSDQPDGRIRVQFSKINRNQVCLKIQDNGSGLPHNFQIDKAKSLGMTIINNLVEQLSGKIEMAVNQGTEFTLVLPVNDHPGN